jgi:dUTP pyrophosphatase
MIMIVRFKRLHADAVVPSYAKEGDAGLDLTAVAMSLSKGFTEYDTGLAFEIPQGYVGLVFPRSSISKMGNSLANAVAVIDSGFRGSVRLRMRVKAGLPTYRVGDKVGQLIILPYPSIDLLESNILSDTFRGQSGFGSSG